MCNKSLCSLFFIKFLSPHQTTALQKPQKMLFISFKKPPSPSRYSNFCIFVFPSFFLVIHCFRGWFKKNLNAHDVINCLNKNLITYYIWYLEKEIGCDIDNLSIDRVLNTEHFYGKIMQNSLRAIPRPLFNSAK